MDPRPLVRVVTAGSVDDGKSTFLGRLLYECDAILDDQLAAIRKASELTGETETNLALLTDGLRAERSQKITIDVAYRHFATPKRRFLLADSPGHEQYTRNMFTGASTADIAIILLDAERGPTVQTWRHAFLTSLLRVPHVVVAINKMDRVDFQEEVFNRWADQFREFAAKLSFADLRFVPISALKGDGVARRSTEMPWYSGQSVLELLNDIEVSPRTEAVGFRFPVQLAIRPGQDFRGYAGSVMGGSIRVGEEVVALPSGRSASIATLSRSGDPAERIHAGDSAVVSLDRELDLRRGELLCRPQNRPELMAGIDATICWMGEAPARLNARYRLQCGPLETTATLAEIVYAINPETLHRETVPSLELNQIARVLLRLPERLPFDRYESNRHTGSFILTELDSHQVAAAGIVLRDVEDENQARLGRVIWMTGLSGAGKSTLSDLLSQRLRNLGHPVVQLDGDQLREGLNRDLGFSEADRNENIRRCAEVAKLLASQGVIVVCSLISPLATQRAMARAIIGEGFAEVFVDCPLEAVIQRDPKGLYARAIKGEIPSFTGISAPYEPPETPELHLRTDQIEPETCIQMLLGMALQKHR